MDDSIQARISSSCPENIRHVLLLAWSRDLEGIQTALRSDTALARAVDPSTLETPLHAAVRGCGPGPALEIATSENAGAGSAAEGEDGALWVSEACEVIRELFLSGAIWNDLDSQNETPGCLAWRLRRPDLYELFVEAGVRSELLFGLMGGYEELSSGPEGTDDDDAPNGVASAVEANEAATRESDEADAGRSPVGEADASLVQLNVEVVEAVASEDVNSNPPLAVQLDPPVTSDRFLSSTLTFSHKRILDADGNGVMMAWETDIMRRTLDALLPVASTTTGGASEDAVGAPIARASGRRILNIGFGMGIIDSMFKDTRPTRHHIIEAHPAVLARLASPESEFGEPWQASAEPGAYAIYAGRWQDVVPELLSCGELYDAIYFDTFGEDYAQLKYFFTECVVSLLEPDGGRFGFFNGLGADRQVCYDVYARVVEINLADAGLDVEWTDVDVHIDELAEAGKGDWKGVRRRYWTLDSEPNTP